MSSMKKIPPLISWLFKQLSSKRCWLPVSWQDGATTVIGLVTVVARATHDLNLKETSLAEIVFLIGLALLSYCTTHVDPRSGISN